MNSGVIGGGPDDESASFWQSLTEHRIELQTCPACGHHRFPPMPSCPYCAGVDYQVVDVAGTGSIYSWVRVHRALSAAMADEVPYCIVTVNLDGGGRMFGRMAAEGNVGIGHRVRPVFVDHADHTELRFELDGNDGALEGASRSDPESGRG
jgi:uncharacterized OB-fold protein